MVTPGGGGGGCSLLEEQPAQMTSALAKKARKEACLTAKRRFANKNGALRFPADMCCGRRATRNSGSFIIRFASRSRPSACASDASTALVQAMPLILPSSARCATYVQVSVTGSSLEGLCFGKSNQCAETFFCDWGNHLGQTRWISTARAPRTYIWRQLRALVRQLQASKQR